MPEGYMTSQPDLPEDPQEETVLQVADKATREIYRTRARVAREPDALSNPKPLTVVRGPHENIREEWYIEIVEPDITTEEEDGIDRELLRTCHKRVREGSNVVNTRSDNVKSLLLYFVESGEYDSLSEASRSILLEHVAENHPSLLDAYVEVKLELEQADIESDLREYRDGV